MGDQEIRLTLGRLKRPQETKPHEEVPVGGAAPEAVRHAHVLRNAEPATTSEHAPGA